MGSEEADWQGLKHVSTHQVDGDKRFPLHRQHPRKSRGVVQLPVKALPEHGVQTMNRAARRAMSVR